jgi:hypothetical protein
VSTVPRPEKNYLRPNQTGELEQTLQSIDSTLADPHSRRHIQDPGAMRKQRSAAAKTLETFAPPRLRGAELDRVAKREQEYRKDLMAEMPSQEEMRKNPPGAVGKHQRFEKRNKNKILQWKNDRLTIGIAQGGNDDPDLANLELYRPVRSTLNMDNAQIPGADYNFPSPQFQENYEKMNWSAHRENGPESADASDPEADLRRALAEKDAEIERLRAETEARSLDNGIKRKKKKVQRNVSPEQREASRQRMQKYWADKKAREAAEASKAG